MDRSYSETKLPPSWCHWRTDDGSERSRKKKNTAPRWFEKQEKILRMKGGSWRSKKMETTVHQSNISIFHKSLDRLISSKLNNNHHNNYIKAKIKCVLKVMTFGSKRLAALFTWLSVVHLTDLRKKSISIDISLDSKFLLNVHVSAQYVTVLYTVELYMCDIFLFCFCFSLSGQLPVHH